jgi:hypothetical protein
VVKRMRLSSLPLQQLTENIIYDSASHLLHGSALRTPITHIRGKKPLHLTFAFLFLSGSIGSSL